MLLAFGVSETDAEKFGLRPQINCFLLQRRRSRNSKSPTAMSRRTFSTPSSRRSAAPAPARRLAYLKALQALEIDYVEQITKMGVLPKNIASQTTTE